MGASGVRGGERGRKGTGWHKIAVHGIVWYCMVQCNLLYGIAWYHVVLWCCKWKGEGESVTHSQVNEQWHYSAWQPGKMHSGLILLLILQQLKSSSAWKWVRQIESINWGLGIFWRFEHLIKHLHPPFDSVPKKEKVNGNRNYLFVEIRNPHQREVGFFINILNHETQKWLFSPVQWYTMRTQWQWW